jgi:hypothetical protein
MKLARLAALFLLIAAAGAEELRIDDVRLIAMPLLGDAIREHGSITSDSAGTSEQRDISGTGGLRYHQRVGLGWYRSLYGLEDGKGSFLWGGEFAYDQLGDEDKRARGGMVDGFVGWAWAFTPRWHIEHGLMLGAGAHRWQIDTDGGESEDLAFAYEYGIRIGTYYTLGSRWQAGIEGRFAAMRSSIHSDDERHAAGQPDRTISYDVETQIDGFGITASVGYRF